MIGLYKIFVLGAISYAAGASIHEVGIADTMASDDPAFAFTGVFDNYALTEWKYAAQTEGTANAPADWNNVNAVCGTGTSQSPIDVVTADVMTEATDVGAIEAHNLDLNLDGYLANTGRLLSWMYFGYTRPTIRGGPLGTKFYALSHINFHFGSTNTQGSEHTMDGSQSPMEMQMIFYDGTFQSIQDAQASTNPDALVGFSTLFEVKYYE